MKRYSPRPVRFLRLLERDERLFKLYSITLPDEGFRESQFQTPIESLFDALPQPGRTDGRPGVGFIICHQGATADYLICAWWDRENELPMLISVRPPGEDWRPSAIDEGVCVWDLEVIGFERDAYVETFLSGLGSEEWSERTWNGGNG